MRISDWSSDVCSSDLCQIAPIVARASVGGKAQREPNLGGTADAATGVVVHGLRDGSVEAAREVGARDLSAGPGVGQEKGRVSGPVFGVHRADGAHLQAALLKPFPDLLQIVVRNVTQAKHAMFG